MKCVDCSRTIPDDEKAMSVDCPALRFGKCFPIIGRDDEKLDGPYIGDKRIADIVKIEATDDGDAKQLPTVNVSVPIESVELRGSFVPCKHCQETASVPCPVHGVKDSIGDDECSRCPDSGECKHCGRQQVGRL